jgi:hypothetical protein
MELPKVLRELAEPLDSHLMAFLSDSGLNNQQSIIKRV